MRTCVTPEGTFVYGIHKPAYRVRNLRSRTRIENLGVDQHGSVVDNEVNYPPDDVEVEQADWIYEIANPLSFRGSTFIGKGWADRSAANPGRIRLVEKAEVSLHRSLEGHGLAPALIDTLPRPLLLGLATSSTDGADLVRLAHISCRLLCDEDGLPMGLYYSDGPAGTPEIIDFELFEAVANNVHLPNEYKIAMVIRPGAQGHSEIMGDYHKSDATHIYEYLRTNSYIGGGHYAANMADDAIRYRIADLTKADIYGLRHLYYQRCYARFADFLAIPLPDPPLSEEELEELRQKIAGHMDLSTAEMASTLWGWNFGFDFSSSGFRLHASHQQIHQQYAMIPNQVEGFSGSSDKSTTYKPYSSGDMIEELITAYRNVHDSSFFNDYIQALETNVRMDGRDDLNRELIVWQDDQVVLFVPKAQTSQWELQLMTRPNNDGGFPGTIIETPTQVRRSLDLGILMAQKALAGLGASMVTTIEYSKRFFSKLTDQPLIYCFLPKLPQSMGAFSEAQLRFINGHYPEDFALVCRQSLREQGLTQE
ncbi:MAG: hypothetical protein HKP44_07115 [Desulfofustis sp.]|nr:hypothetical protein [Desulfofustis sp.]